MPDSNMSTAYNWACQLVHVSQLQVTIIHDITNATDLVIKIQSILGAYIEKDMKSSGTGLLERFSTTIKEVILNRIDDVCRQYDHNVNGEQLRKSFGLRLWSGCIFAAKTIALETMDGPVTPEQRTSDFQSLDNLANIDSVFGLGIECAPLFKKLHQQCYSFNGVPVTSPVRKYPNEYLIDRFATDAT